ncbi:hypothetical protein Zm00014a_031535 [Zea mays]|uniref:Protease Do-like 9 n=1 Tax=Zea mays TaxID=4577 RepID=A0A3L6DLX8_MAIZE|nr:hypothetical protein Zm00014a_031535 [Zea mays]
MDDPSSASNKHKRKRGRKPKASPPSLDRSSPSPSVAPTPTGHHGRKPRRHEALADMDATRPPSPPCRGEPKPVANRGDVVAVAECGPASWDEVVKLKKRGFDTKYLATVLAIGTDRENRMHSNFFIVFLEKYTKIIFYGIYETSEAIASFELWHAHLTVNDDEFWEGVSPIEFGTLPVLQDAVTVVGYPIGRDTISVTSGVVSRIEILSYVHGSTELLGLQIDAAINSGNSGGPTFNDRGKCVGIAFQSLKHEDAENICYVIPTPIITHFIEDYKKSGEYTGCN